ncbi:MAG: hypothetical protein JSW46_01450 [Gemmatimonadota bacterium]|nr:MAG: hypothetical protein JSW46_01450 [Gemmatimonadota bacterium]
MRKQRWITATAVALALAVGVACGDDESVGPEVTPGTMIVSLTTPNADDGAIMFTVSGGEIDAPALLDIEHVLYLMEGANTITAIIAGDIVAGGLLEFDVPDVEVAYTATITQVADRTNDLRDPLTGYSLTVDPEVE